jgi:signal transduction histidine kinase
VAQLQADFNVMAGELERAVRDLQAERDKVAVLLQARQQMTASVSHELRTPVATLRGYLQSSRARLEGQLPEPLARDLAVMEGEVLRLQSLIEDLFALSRAEVGALPLDLQPTDVGALVGRRVKAMAPLAWRANRVEVVQGLAADLPPAMADEGRLEQVLTNLLRNGVQHTLPGGIVAVAAGVEGQEIRIDVRDTGEGIAEEDLPYIWDRFYRGQARDGAEKGGAGLGLALVKELAEAMGGRVAVDCTAGQGSCFTVRLPRA